MPQGTPVRPGRVRRDLDHQHPDQLVGRIDPEIRAPDATPVEAADGARNKTELRIDANGEAQPPARTHLRTDILADDARETDVGRQGIRRHLLHGLGLKDAHATELAAVQQHLAEAQVVGRGRGKTAATHEQRGGLGDVPQRRPAARGRVDQPRELVRRHEEAGIDHAERLEDPVLKEPVERPARSDLDQAAQHVDAMAVFPGFARLMNELHAYKIARVLSRRNDPMRS